MAPDLQPRGLKLIARATEPASARAFASRLLAAWHRLMTVAAQWRAVEVREPVIGAEDVEWVWSFLRRRGAYSPRRTP